MSSPRGSWGADCAIGLFFIPFLDGVSSPPPSPPGPKRVELKLACALSHFLVKRSFAIAPWIVSLCFLVAMAACFRCSIMYALLSSNFSVRPMSLCSLRSVCNLLYSSIRRCCSTFARFTSCFSRRRSFFSSFLVRVDGKEGREWEGRER